MKVTDHLIDSSQKIIDRVRLIEKRERLCCQINPFRQCGVCGLKLCTTCNKQIWKEAMGTTPTAYESMGDVWIHYGLTDCPKAKSTVEADHRRALS
jgi:hypothetical protein